MKKTVIMIAIAALVVTVGVAAYAHYEDSNRGWGMRGNQQRMYGRRGSMMSGPGQMCGRGPGNRWNASPQATCPCGARGNVNDPTQQSRLTQMITEDKAKEVAQEYLNKYLSAYSIDTIEKDSWRPLYFVTIKGENGATQMMVVHGFSGQVVNVLPQSAAE
jgi:hypothetical protein